jgi:hypothetical protein
MQVLAYTQAEECSKFPEAQPLADEPFLSYLTHL